MKYELFTTPSCPKCPKMKSLLKDSGLEGEHFNAFEEKGLRKAREKRVSSVPTAVFLKDGVEVGRATSVKEVKKFIK